MRFNYWYNAEGGKYLSEYIKKMTRIEKLKYALIQEYKEGRFYSIPDELMERRDELEDFFSELKRLYEESEESLIGIPEGLYDKDAETGRLVSVLKEKEQKGIQIDTLFIPDGNYNEEERNFLDELKKKNPPKKESMKEKAYRILLEVEAFLDCYDGEDIVSGNPFLMTIIENESYLEFDDYEPDEFTVFECNELQKVMRTANKGENGVVFSEYLIQRFDTKYASKFEELEVGFDFLMSSSVERFLRYEQFSKRDDLIQRGEFSGSTIETLNKQKKFLQDMVEILSNAGFLENYIRVENGKRDIFNQMFSENEDSINSRTGFQNGMFPHISKNSIIEEIANLDMSRKEDAIKMYLYTISYANQLVNGYSAYAVTSLMLQTVGENEFLRKKYYAEREKKKKQEKGTYDKEPEFAKKTRIIISDTLEFYCSDIVGDLYNSMQWYQYMARMDNANDLKFVPFSKFLEDMLKARNVSHAKIPKLSFSADPAKSVKFTKEIADFIRGLEYEDVLSDIDKVLPIIAKKLEFASLFSSVAKTASLSLLNAYKENPQLLTLRLDKDSDSKNGKVIVFLPGEFSFHKISYAEEDFGDQGTRFFVLPTIENCTSEYISSGLECVTTEYLPHGLSNPRDNSLLEKMNETFEYIETVPIRKRTMDKMNSHYKYWEISSPTGADDFCKSLRIMSVLSQGTEYFKSRLLKSEYQEYELTDDETSSSRLLASMLCNRKIPDEMILNGKIGINNTKVYSAAIDIMRKLYEEAEMTGKPVTEKSAILRQLNIFAQVSGVNAEGNMLQRNVQNRSDNDKTFDGNV